MDISKFGSNVYDNRYQDGDKSKGYGIKNTQITKVPYGARAKDGRIEYKGVVFICDERTNSINLGDVSDKKNVMTVNLAGGGTLNVHKDNFGDLSDAISMFSPEDIKRILTAMAEFAKKESAKNEIEEIEDVTDREKFDFAESMEEYRAYVQERIENGPVTFQTGGKAYSEDEWDALLRKVDANIDAVKEEQEERTDRLQEKEEKEDSLTEEELAFLEAVSRKKRRI